MKSSSVAVFVLSSLVGVMADQPKGVPVPSQLPKVGETTSQGCWHAKGSTWKQGPLLDFPSMGSCSAYCKSENSTVASTKAEECWCGDDYPPSDASAALKNCNYPCPGYDPEACGALGTPGYYSVYNTGIKADVPNAPDPSSTTSSPTATSTNARGETIIVTQPAATESSSTGSSGGGGSGGSGGSSGSSNTVGIAVGVVVGLVLLAGAVGGGYFWLRKKKRQEAAEERRRADAVSAFVGHGSKPSSISGSFADSRLDPVMAHRRMSDGSIADNQDYSRKILRVTNA